MYGISSPPSLAWVGVGERGISTTQEKVKEWDESTGGFLQYCDISIPFLLSTTVRKRECRRHQAHDVQRVRNNA